MDENIIALGLANFPLVMLILAFLYALIIPGKLAPRLFAAMLFLCVGCGGIWGFVMHCFFTKIAAGNIGWASSPFEFEVALANLALGITGLIAVFANWSFRSAVVVFTTVFLWGAAGGIFIKRCWLVILTRGTPVVSYGQIFLFHCVCCCCYRLIIKNRL